FTNNLFIGAENPATGKQLLFGLWIDTESHDALVQGNTFTLTRNPTTSAPFVAILSGGKRSTIRDNLVLIANADNSTVGIFLYSDLVASDAQASSVEDNFISTGGRGTGLEAASTEFGFVSVSVQGNDFEHNAIGVEILGDGSAAGNIDLGG